MSRAGIFSKVKSALQARDGDGRRAVADARVAAPPSHPRPQRASVSSAEARAAFIRHLEAVSAVFAPVAVPDDVPAAIAAFITANYRGEPVTLGRDPWLAALPWSRAPELQRFEWKPGVPPRIAVSRAVAAIAETGTLVLASGPDNPASLNYLPEAHIVVVEASTLKASMEAGLASARQNQNSGAQNLGPQNLGPQNLGHMTMPRTLALVSGASRTADVGGKLVAGAHGPKKLLVILVG